MTATKNPFGLNIRPEPGKRLPGNAPHHAEVTIDRAGYIPAHYHKSGPNGMYDQSNAEIYYWLRGGTLRIFISPDKGMTWKVVTMNARNRTVAILGGWWHGATVVGGKACVFHALSRADHFRPKSQGGNVYRLPKAKQPLDIRMRMYADNKRSRR